MIFPIVVIVIGVVGTGVNLIDLFRNRKQEHDWKGLSVVVFITGAFITSVIAILTYLALSGPVGHITGLRPKHTPYKFPIVAAADGTRTEGSFFIFGGTIDETPMYFFYRQQGNGGIRQGHLKVAYSTIFEDTEGEGYIKVNKYKNHCTWYGCAIHNNTKPNDYYEIHVPPGSVARQFNFDLE